MADGAAEDVVSLEVTLQRGHGLGGLGVQVGCECKLGTGKPPRLAGDLCT